MFKHTGIYTPESIPSLRLLPPFAVSMLSTDEAMIKTILCVLAGEMKSTQPKQKSNSRYVSLEGRKREHCGDADCPETVFLLAGQQIRRSRMVSPHWVVQIVAA